MASREAILTAIRKTNLPAKTAPSLDQAWITYPDRLAHFAQVLEGIGGRCVCVRDLDALNADLAKSPVYQQAANVVSLVDGAGQPNVDLSSIDDPHDLESVDFALTPAQFGVAENGAVWITDEGIRHRAILFITQHLAVVIPTDAIVDNMHQAYERMAAFDRPGFGAFIAGPSKTADIEQSLVIGAHGPRSMTVYCLGEPLG